MVACIWYVQELAVDFIGVGFAKLLGLEIVWVATGLDNCWTSTHINVNVIYFNLFVITVEVMF